MSTYERLIQTTRSLGKKDDETYGMNLTGLQTVHGMIWMKSTRCSAKGPI